MDPRLLKAITALGDAARLRLLRLIAGQELSVRELVKVMQLPQSTVSRHLKLLHDTGWIERRSEGTQSLFRMDEPALDPAARRIWDIVGEQVGPARQLQEDDRRLAEVLAGRRTDSKAFFGRIVGEWDRLRGELFGETFAAEALLSFLDPRWIVADLGCGTGATAELLAPAVAAVVAVDREPQMIEAARRRLHRFRNVEYRQEDLSSLSLDDRSVDAAVISLVMVYMAEPQTALAETARVLRPGGTAMIIDLVPHDRESYRHTMGHHHLGFDEKTVNRWASSCRLAKPRYRRLRPATDAKGPGLFVATMKRPG